MNVSGMAVSALVVGVSNPVIAECDLDGYPPRAMPSRRSAGACPTLAEPTPQPTSTNFASAASLSSSSRAAARRRRSRRAEAAQPPSTVAQRPSKVRNTRLAATPTTAAPAATPAPAARSAPAAPASLPVCARILAVPVATGRKIRPATFAGFHRQPAFRRL
jgi:hypothetical protein